MLLKHFVHMNKLAQIKKKCIYELLISTLITTITCKHYHHSNSLHFILNIVYFEMGKSQFIFGAIYMYQLITNVATN